MQIERSSESARSGVSLGSVALTHVISEVRIGTRSPR
jgi:hypothetical protein